MFGFFFAALLHFLGCPALFLGPPLIWCTRLGCRLNHWGHCSAVDPPRSSSVGGSGSSSRQGGESSGSPSQGGTNLTKKPSKPKKVKTHDKHSSSSGPLPSKPAAAADRALIAASGQHSLAAADRISASNRGGISWGIPWFLAGNSPYPGASKSTLIEVASPRDEPLCVAVSGVPLRTGDVLAQPIPDPPSRGPSLTHVSGMGGVELLFTPLGSWVSRPVSHGSPGTLAVHPFPALPPGIGQVVLPDFASLLCSVSPDLVEPSPGGSQARSVFGGPSFWCASETRPHPAGCPSGLRPNRSRLGPG
jgi:hypothetical protein